MLAQVSTTASLPATVRSLAGFWRRPIAFLIDAFVTAVPCACLGFAFYNFFTTSEAAEILVGFVLTPSYFAVMGSSAGGRQTLGQRLLHIKVVNQQGSSISLRRSLLRSAILLGLILLSSDALPLLRRVGLAPAVDLLIFSAEVLMIYLYLFNRNRRQSLHDLAAKTYVVEARSAGPVERPPCWNGHWAILGGATFLLLLIKFASSSSGVGPFPELETISEAVIASDKVQSVSISAEKTWGHGTTRTGLKVLIGPKKAPPTDFEVIFGGRAEVNGRADFERDATEIAETLALSKEPQKEVNRPKEEREAGQVFPPPLYSPLGEFRLA
jgi:uncharacterized RDD family membrane protein YckC